MGSPICDSVAMAYWVELPYHDLEVEDLIQFGVVLESVAILLARTLQRFFGSL